jgi:hypothetical protein
MKKAILGMMLFSTFSIAEAQEILTKNGTPVLPETHDISISIDAAPLGTLFRNSGSSALSSSYLAGHPQTIIGKYMLNANTAYRVKLRIGLGSASKDNVVPDLFALSTNQNSTSTVIDEAKSSTTNITLGFGIQKYRGKGRLKGYYGGEAMIMRGSQDSTFSYGNDLNSTNYPGGYSRISENKAGSTFGFGLRGFMGAEYFFAAKMSLGVEYGWGLMVSSTGQGTISTDHLDPVAGVTSTSSNSGKSSDFSIDVDNGYGAIMLSLYF